MGVQKLLARALKEVVDAALGDAILEMGAGAAKFELLLRAVTCLLEGICWRIAHCCNGNVKF